MTMIQKKTNRDMMMKRSLDLLQMIFTHPIVRKYRLNETFRGLYLMQICLLQIDRVSIIWRQDLQVKRPYSQNHLKRPKLSFLRNHMSLNKCLCQTIAISMMMGLVKFSFKDFDKQPKIKSKQLLSRKKSDNRKSKSLLLPR